MTTTECTIKADGEKYRLELTGDGKMATVTDENGLTASIGWRRDSYHASALNMSGEADSMREAVDIAIDLIQAAREEEDAA